MRKTLSAWQSFVLLSPSASVIGAFVVVPLVLTIGVSLATSMQNGAPAGFGLANYERLFSPVFLRQTAFSVALALLVSLICLIVTVPFSYFLSGFGRRVRTVWLVFILAQMSLSEVLISFGWQVLLSRTTGVTNLLVWAGLLDKPFSLVPSFWAMLLALVYMAIPFAVLIFFPTFSRLDRSLIEASRTMGASPMRAFMDVVLPVCRPSIVTCGFSVYILTLGSLIIPQLLGKPQHWTLAVHITDQAIYQFNPPFAAALAVMLLGISVIVLACVRILGARNS